MKKGASRASAIMFNGLKPGVPLLAQFNQQTMLQPVGLGDVAIVEERPQRLRTWEISPTFHCSIIGTCLTSGELRQVLIKNGDIDARAASDHVLHGRGVRLAAQHDAGGKLLNKALDRRHETIVRKFARVENVDALRALWRESFDRGDISGAYWAVMSHAIRDQNLIRDVFGEVHMLSHLVGSSSRLDIARLAGLEARLAGRDDKIAKQEARLAAAAAERTTLRAQIAALEERLRRSEGERQIDLPKDKPAILQSDPADRQRIGELAELLRQAREDIRDMQGKLVSAEQEISGLKRENAVIDDLLSSQFSKPEQRPTRWNGGTVLYVGGRRHLFDQIRNLAARHGIDLLFHDGGMEDNTTLLPGLIGQAEAVVFPVDHISHTAAGLVKRVCGDLSKEFVPLRSAGLGSFAAAIAS